MTFQSRWSIEGTLTTRTPLHIGTGKSVELDLPQAGEPNPVKVAALARDHRGRPYVPGTSVKGVLGAWLRARNLVGDTSDLLGHIHAGGKAEVWDALLAENVAPVYPPPRWDPARHCGVEVGVAIDRALRTASDRKLFHQELVPPGAAFAVKVTGLDLSEAEVVLLLAGLAAFNHPQDPLALGADTASGKGRCTWALSRIRRMGPADIPDWLAQDPLPPAQDWLPAIPEPDRRRMELASAQLIATACASARLRLALRVVFDAPFLVNDPPTAKGEANHRPRRDAQGAVYLPARSLRGALRGQAERIVRTLGGHACRVEDPADACPPLRDANQRGGLCLACQVFGATGWRSPVRVSDFSLADLAEHELLQEFVAIDRFTGGGAEGLKFNTESCFAPVLAGEVEIDLSPRRMDPWGLGLLALTLRDLAEGDVTLGLGASKGYGTCRARVTGWSLARSGVRAQAEGKAGDWPPVLDEAQADLVRAAVQALREKVATTPDEEANHVQ